MFKLFHRHGAPQAPAAPPQRPVTLTAKQRELAEKIDQYKWYHRIEVEEGLFTLPVRGGFPVIWDFILANLAGIQFQGRRVLDIGCRDGLFSFEAERRGAARVHGIDNDLSLGAQELLIPHFQSKVEMERLNLYDLEPKIQGTFDLIMFFGVLYHLRYPFWGLKQILRCLEPGGELLIESGMLRDSQWTKDLEILYCPVENSPYEVTSCTFYNTKGLVTTLHSFGMELVRHDILTSPADVCASRDGKVFAERQFFVFKKTGTPTGIAGIMPYWNEVHAYHTVETKDKPK